MVRDRAWRSALLVGTVIAVLMGSVVTQARPAGAAVWTAPTFLRNISGPSRPGVAAWGLDYNPVTDEFVVGDYVSNQVRLFSRTGKYLGDFTNPGNSAGSIVSAVAVDKRDGSVYAATTSLTSLYSIRKYDKNGHFMFGFKAPDRVAWLTVDDAGNVWFPLAYGSYQVFKFSVNDATHTATQLQVLGTRGTGPGQALFDNGIDVASNGDVYVADAINRRVHVYANNGPWKFDIGTDQIFQGDLRGIVVDDRSGRVYVADAKGAQIEVFNLTGTHLLTIGSEGDGPGQFGSGPRQLTVTPDGEVWAADYSGLDVEQFDPDGTFRSRFPWPSMTPDPHGLMDPWGVGIDPANGDVLVGDHFGQRISRFSSTGALLQIFGRRGRLPENGLNYPRGVAVDPATEHVWVLNAEGAPYLVEYDQNFNVVKQITTLDLSTGLVLLGNEAYVVYRSRGIQVFNMTTGALARSYSQVGSGTYQGLGVDPLNGRMWVPIRDLAQVRVLNPNGTLLMTLPAVKSSTGVAFLGSVAYVTDTGGNTIIAYDRATGTKLGSFGSQGTGPGQLYGPKGIAVGPDGNLYVAEANNGRVQVFTFNPPPPPDTNKPSLTITSPAAASTTAQVPVRLTGTASDDSGIAAIDVTVLDGNTGLYYNVRAGTWTTASYFNQAIFEGPTTNGTWSFSIVPASYGKHFTVKVRATDLSGNTKIISESFDVDDLVPPVPAIDTPAAADVITPGPLAASGSVTDDGPVDVVEIGLHDPATGMWWYPAGGWSASEYWAPTAFSTSGSTTTWSGSIDVARLAGSGPFDLYARAFDAKGNEGRSVPVSISVGADTVAPNSVISVPTQDQQLAVPATLSGTATDGTSVAGVQAALKDRTTGLWWKEATSTWGPLTWNAVSMDSPGATTTGWSWSPVIGPGSYFIQTRATDGAGNVETSFPSARFSTTTSVVDTGPPDTTVTSPANGAQVSTPIAITGTAIDDLSVAAVQAALKDKVSGLWWNASAGTWGAVTWNATTLSSPGAATTNWSWSPAVGAGDYLLQARAVDGVGQIDPTRPSVSFTAVTPATVPWTENFDLPDGTTVDTGPTAWTLTYSGTGVADVQGSNLYFQVLGSEAVWQSESIDISGHSSITVQVSWQGQGTLDPPDTLKASYRVDGGLETQFALRSGPIAAETVSATGLHGSTLQVIIRSLSSGTDEAHVVTGVSVLAV